MKTFKYNVLSIFIVLCTLVLSACAPASPAPAPVVEKVPNKTTAVVSEDFSNTVPSECKVAVQIVAIDIPSDWPYTYTPNAIAFSYGNKCGLLAGRLVLHETTNSSIDTVPLWTVVRPGKYMEPR